MLQKTGSFFDLSKQGRARWDQLLQSAPVLRAATDKQSRAGGSQSKKRKQAGMTLEQFDHICRAAAAVAGVKKVHVFGANAVPP